MFSRSVLPCRVQAALLISPAALPNVVTFRVGE